MNSIHVFPFESVEKGSSIIIYGAGKVGQEYISQVKITNYCNIKFVVDSNYNKINNYTFSVISPDKINENDDYDWIIVSVESKRTANEIIENLKSMNIDINKVIYPTNRSIPYNQLIVNNPQQFWGKYTYSQYGDDLIVLNIFNSLCIQKPSYLDLGAHHPYNLSNTAILYSRGCRGINVEANPDLILAFQNERPADINLSVGVGIKTGSLPFYIIEGIPECNTFSKKAADDYIENNPEYSITEVKDIKIITLEEIIKKYANNIFPDYLSIDVEGLDYEILKSYDMTNNGPKVISVEISDAQYKDKNNIIKLLKSYGYFIYCKANVNYIFVKENYKDLLY